MNFKIHSSSLKHQRSKFKPIFWIK